VHSKENEIQAYLKQHACPKKFRPPRLAPQLCKLFLVPFLRQCTNLVRGQCGRVHDLSKFLFV
jgi:hypothetical protein